MKYKKVSTGSHPLNELMSNNLCKGCVANESEGYNVLESVFPINPFEIEPTISVEEAIELVKEWKSVWESVRESVRAYISSLFPNVKKWKHIEHEEGVNPFQSAIDLWRAGYVSSFDGKIWRLHTKDGIVWEEQE